ncbi:2-oxoglutarate and Fe(II)-dependent oxygenase superfamily protein [Thalictrum thalictroides]|uniref:2-oxoglutarate and Fe(II)-dependent oxygenase superfamily protein n=1 Tax=Thalictrum thalictroides TaxID=46969 RepID=A0A7J6XBB2_THATH|nr:2-oxoglutarate and Fe(II)-dependent oxygenase superfamily protein [Thalictrum thalictroides]
MASSVETFFRPNIGCVKDLAESSDLISIPSKYSYFNTQNQEDGMDEVVAELVQIPTIDFSILNSTFPDQRSKVIQDIGKACQDWGFFMVINHGVPESLMERMLAMCRDFFDQTEEEKLECAGKHVLAPIRFGTSFNSSVDKVFFWRDFLKVLVHPQFHSPSSPAGFSEISMEYCEKTRQVARELLKAISESLGLEENCIDKTMELESCFQILISNLYPPCPQPDLAMGMPPHSDHGLLTLLIQNQNGGLQLNHNGKWVNVHASPNTFLVNTGDHLEILSNGKYKSVLHRAVVNNKVTRISLAVTHGPCLDKVVAPVAELVDSENNPALYHGMKYKEYLEFQQSNQLNGKSHLDRIRI